MIICKVCSKETSTPINYEFICFKCYDERLKNKGIKTKRPREIKEDNTEGN